MAHNAQHEQVHRGGTKVEDRGADEPREAGGRVLRIRREGARTNAFS